MDMNISTYGMNSIHDTRQIVDTSNCYLPKCSLQCMGWNHKIRLAIARINFGGSTGLVICCWNPAAIAC